MGRVLGVDLGTNSIGWALIDHDEEKVIDMGSRIFPVGVNEDKFNKSGTEESKNLQRRAARGARRNLYRRKLRARKLRETLDELGMLPDFSKPIATRTLYGLRKKALDEKIPLDELGRIIYLINNRRGFKSNKKAQSDEDVGVVKKAITDLEEEIEAAGARTVGEYFAGLFEQNEEWRNDDEPVKRIRNRYTSRKMYETEFDLIWEKQREYHPDTLTDDNRRRIRDEIVFYQRRLKSAKGLVKKCRFERNKRVAPMSSFLFQEYRMWQILNNIRVPYGERVSEALNEGEKQTIADALAYTEDISQAQVKKALKMPRNAAFNDVPLRIPGNKTRAKIVVAVGRPYYDNLSDEEKRHLWHVLHFAEDPEWIEEHALERLGMSAAQAKKFAHVHLEKDYGNLSSKALGKILPHLKEGYEYSEACAKAGYHHSWDEEKDGKDRELEPVAIFHDEGIVNSPIVKRAIYETVALVNAVAKKYGKPNEVRLEMARELKKPKDVREKMRKGNQEKEDLRDAYRKFLKEKHGVEPSGADILKFELWLELEFDERDLEKRNGDVDIEEYKKFAKNISVKDVEKFRLWLECDRISVYTGKPISLGLLFSPEIEVEHIVPYSRSMDNSFINKTLSEKGFNNDKGNRLPMEYLKGRPEENAYKARVKHFSQAKREKLLMEKIPEDFLNSQLNNTAYVAVEVKKCLKQAYRDVRITNGQATGVLRREWGLNGLLRDPDAEGVSPAVKSRADHRHHAIDALVVALTTDGIVNRLSRLSQQDIRVKKPISSLKTEQDVESIKDRGDRDLVIRHINKHGGMENIRKALEEPILHDPMRDGSTRTLRWVYMNSVPLPWGGMKPSALRRLVEEKLKTVFVSHRNKKRLVTSKLNKYKYRRGEKLKQKTFAARGALHEETNLGVIEDSHRGGETIYVTRKSVETISTKKHIEKIVDPEIRKIILRHVEKNGGKIPAAMKVPILYNAKKSGKEIPLKTVRMEVRESNPIQIRPDKNKKLFVASGANYAVGVYEDDEGKRAFEVLRFYDAVQKRLRGERLFPPEIDGKKFAYTLKHNDMVVVYKESPDEIDWDDKEDLFERLYKVVKYTVTKRVWFRKHNLAQTKEGLQDPTEKAPRFGNVNIAKNSIKVEVDRLGTIVRR